MIIPIFLINLVCGLDLLCDELESQELRLYNAIKISRLMNRILILPVFHCGDSGKKCSFGDIYSGGHLLENIEDVRPHISFVLYGV